MSIASSPTSADIELNAGEEASGNLAPVEAAGQSSAHYDCGCSRVCSPNRRLSQATNGSGQLHGSGDAGHRRPATEQLVVTLQSWFGRVTHAADYSKVPSANRPPIVSSRAEAPLPLAISHREARAGGRSHRVAARRGIWFSVAQGVVVRGVPPAFARADGLSSLLNCLLVHQIAKADRARACGGRLRCCVTPRRPVA